jgi:hypothetical protein
MYHTLKIEFKFRTPAAGMSKLQYRRTETWEQPVTVREKPYGDAVNLEPSTAFFKLINVSA